MNANACSQLAGASSPSARRSSGVRSRSGSSCRSANATPLGQRKPCEKTSSASPRTRTTSSPRTVTARPQVASQNGQVRNAVRSSMAPDPTGLGAVALLVLLARAAPARVVATELLVLVDAPLLDHGAAGRRLLARLPVRGRLVLGGAARVLHRRRAAAAAPLVGQRAVAVRARHLDLDVVDHPREVRPDAVHQVLEEREALVLVSDERVDLGEPAQVDPLAQVVHVVEVLAPALVDDLQQQEALQRPHQLLAEIGLALLVELERVLDQQLHQPLAVEALAVELLDAEVDVEDLVELHPQAVEVPFPDVVARRVLLDEPLDHLDDLLARRLADVLALEDAVAVLVDDLALLVHHVVVLEHALADEEVLLLDLALGVLDLLREHLRLDRLLLALLADRAEAVEDAVDPVAREQAHEVVLGGQEEARLAGVALAAGAAAQLVVDPARLVALGADDEQAAGLEHLLAVVLDPRLDRRQHVLVALLVVRVSRTQAELGELELREVLGVAAELDVDAAAGHVGRDRDRAGAPGLGDRLALTLGVLRLGVEHRVRDALALELPAEVLGDLDGDRADEHRLALRVALLDLAHDRCPLAVLRLEDLVVAIGADHRLVGRDLHDRQLVDLHELVRLGQRRAGHAGELRVHAEVVLERDRGERLVLLLDADALLRLDRLVQPLRPAPAVEDAAGELVDDLDLAVNDRVVDVALVQRLGLERLVEVVDERAVLGLVEVVDAEESLGLLDALLGDRDGLVLLVELEVEVRDELLLRARVHALGALARLHDPCELGEADVQLGCLLGGAGDDQRRARLVDQDVVDLVDDRVLVHVRLAVRADPATVLDLLLQRRGHVVAQVVEAELGVRAVGDVGLIGGDLVGRRLHVLQHADGEAEAGVDRRHPLGVAAGEVVVDGDDVDALAGQRVERDGERRRERLALAGLHLGDRAAVQHHAADHLDVEVAHPHRAAGGLAHDRERLGEQVVQRFAVARALAEGVGLGAHLAVVEQLELGLPGVDAVDALRVLLELLAFAQPESAIEERHGSEDRGPRSPLGPRVAHRTGCRYQAAAASPGPSSTPVDPELTSPTPGVAARCSRRRRRLSRCRLTWRASSSEIRLIECLRSREDSRARSVVPFRRSVASATWLSGLAGLRSSDSSTSRTASSLTCLAIFSKRRVTHSRSSSVTGRLRPLTSICMGRGLLSSNRVTGPIRC